MESYIKKKMPSWCEDTKTDYKLLITDDLDSLMCYNYQRNKFNRECYYFYNQHYEDDKQIIYKTDNINVNDILALDCALDINIRAWDNHVVKVTKDDDYNKLSANLNIVKNVNSKSYKYKACVSSYLTMLSYYSEFIFIWSDYMKAVLCAIDGLYEPFLPEKDSFKEIAKENLRLLNCSYLIEFMEDENNIKLIKRLKQELNLGEYISVGEDMKLHTDIDLKGLSDIFSYEIKLPDVQFTDSIILNKYKVDYITEKPKNCFNFALTYKNSAIYSKFI